LTSIDWYIGIRHKSGATASRGLASAVARAIKRAVGENSVSAYLGDGRFATLLIGQTTEAIKVIAATITKDFASRESHHESVPRPTLSHAIVTRSAEQTPEEFLVASVVALDVAEHSGGDRIVLRDEFANELAAWQEEMTSGNPFAAVVAQDIMEP